MNATSHPMNGEVTMGMLEHTLSPLSVSCPYSDPNCDDYDGLTRRERILLRPWLENLIDSGQVPGLEWIDRPKYVFKVPWKHRSKKSWSVEHSSVFLEWAKNTGRWREGDPEPNYAQLKTRLRCAFNKAPDIQEIKELHKTKCEDAYKVYRFVPKKESRFGNFKKKMLIPTSIKRRHCSWIGSGLKFQGIGRKLKQENALEPVSEIKMEPLCGSPDGYEGLSNNAPVRYDREVYPMDDEDRRPPSPCTSTSTSLRDETRYTMKYPKQQALSEYLPDDGPASYPNGTGSDQVRLQAFPDIAAELSRRAGNVEGIAQDGSFNSVGGCGRAPISNATYRRNYDEHQFQSTKFQGVDVNNPYGMVLRQSFQESDACTNQHSFSGVANQRRYPNAFLDNNATTAAGFATHRGSPSVQHLKFRSGCDKSYPVDDSMNMQRMYHHSPQRLNQERFNQEKFNQEKFNQDRFNQERFNLSNVGQGFSMSSSYDNVKLQKSSLQLPQQPKGRDRDLPPENKPSPPSRTSDVSDLPMLSSISGRPPPSADCFYSERPALEPLASRASEHIETMSHVSCQDKGVEKIPDSCCSVPEGSELLHSQQDSHGMEMKNKVFQGQMPFLTPSKPAGPNVLDLTKKVKMAVAPFIAHKAQTMDMNNSDAAKRASSGSHLSSQNPFEKFSEHLNDPLTNAKVMDLIEWERRLIERERELLARERLMTHKEKQLRELELAFKLDHKVEMSNHGEYPPKRQNDTCQTSIRLDKSSSSVMKDDRNNDFRGAKSTCPQSSPPPLSPLRTFAYNDRPYRDSRWPRGCFKGDASSMTSSSSSDSDIYYSQLVQNNNLKYINRDLPALERAEATNSEKLRLNALFINNARNEYTNAVTLHGVTQDWNKFSPEVLVISKNKETYESNAPSDVEEETSRNQDQIAVADKSCSDEFVKVLPVVDSMNSEDVLHIAKLPDKIPDEKEIAASRENGDSSYSSYKSSSTSSATEKESASGKEDFHEEVWKRRMKWMSFQCLQNNALSQVKPTGSSGHWIWPDIGNLTGQRQEQSKLEEGD